MSLDNLKGFSVGFLSATPILPDHLPTDNISLMRCLLAAVVSFATQIAVKYYSAKIDSKYKKPS